ncbi:MAG TPA: hypothetical protein VMB82_12470, partial [Acidimicrobiales bacterium]|nr:hypothetical protein [Acidimicrobiales bacterium]
MGRAVGARKAADPPQAPRRSAGGVALTSAVGHGRAPQGDVAGRHHRVADLECVVNVSEGRDGSLLQRFTTACRGSLLDVHADPDHNRSVFTLAGPAPSVERDARALTQAVVSALDFTTHEGCHPAFGVIDVVPFVPLRAFRDRGAQNTPPVLDLDPPLDDAVAARDRFAEWAGRELGLACHLYGPLPNGRRTLPEVRRAAGKTL